jgi:alpha-glucosidase
MDLGTPSTLPCRRPRGEYYLHLFLTEQPDLNWRNPEVETATFEQARFWLDRGVDGFRLDVINYIVKDAGLTSNPYRLRLAPPRRHDLQHHAYDRNQPETHDILRRFRSLMNRYGETMLVGEIYPDEGVHEPETSAAYQGDGSNELHLAFDFSPMFIRFSARSFQRVLRRWYAAAGEHRWPCHVLSNHDQSRAMTRLCRGSEEKARLLALVLMTQRGTPFLYYGEEIGMEDGRIPRRSMRDPVGLKYWPFHPGRDRARTPMQWSGEGNNAGFSTARGETACASWLPVNPDHPRRNAALQQEDPQSLLSWYSALIALRKSSPALHRGEIEFLPSPKHLLLYRRRYGDESLIVALNFSARQVRMPGMPEFTEVLACTGSDRSFSGILPGYQGLIAGENSHPVSCFPGIIPIPCGPFADF